MPRHSMPRGREAGRRRAIGGVVSDGNAPAIARASALNELASRLSPSNVNLARVGLAHSDP